MTIEDRIAKAKEILGELPQVKDQNRCETGKKMYRTKQDARHQKEHHEQRISLKKRGLRFDPYLCKKCGWWHLSTKHVVD